jgi:hypothetical protein
MATAEVGDLLVRELDLDVVRFYRSPRHCEQSYFFLTASLNTFPHPCPLPKGEEN